MEPPRKDADREKPRDLALAQQTNNVAAVVATPKRLELKPGTTIDYDSTPTSGIVVLLWQQYQLPESQRLPQRFLEEEREKMVRILTHREPSTWRNKDLFRFLKIIPRDVDASAIEHVENILMLRVERLDKGELWLALNYFVHIPQTQLVAERTARLIEFIVTSRVEQFDAQQLLEMMALCSIDQKQSIVVSLYSRRHLLSISQLLQLSRFLFLSPPSPEIQDLMNIMYEKDKERTANEASRVFGLIRPAYQRIDAATGQRSEKKKSIEYFQQSPSNKSSFFLDVHFNPVAEQQIYQTGIPSYSYGIMLAGEIQANHGAQVYLLMPPLYSTDKAPLIGFLSADNPLLPLTYPLPAIGSVTAARIGIVIVPDAKINSELNIHTQDQQSPIRMMQDMKGISTGLTPAKRLRAWNAPQQGDSTPGFGPDEKREVVVCAGETHVFKLDQADTFDGLLQRAARRWNVSAALYELQDQNFRTLPPEEKVLATMAREDSNIIKFVQKPQGTTTTHNLFAPLQQPQQLGQQGGMSPFFPPQPQQQQRHGQPPVFGLRP